MQNVSFEISCEAIPDNSHQNVFTMVLINFYDGMN